MNKNLLKSFIIGASPFVFIPFYLGLNLIPEKNIDMKTYAILTSLYFGILNMLATYIGEKYHLTLKQRLGLITIVSILIIWSILAVFKPYNFKTRSRWMLHYMLVMIAHTIAFMVIIYNLELFFS